MNYTLPERIEEGSRNTTLYQLARSLARLLPPDQVTTALTEVNSTRCYPPLDHQELQNLLTSALAGSHQTHQEGSGSTIYPAPNLTPVSGSNAQLNESYVASGVVNLFSPVGREALSYLAVTRPFTLATIKQAEWGYDPEKVAIIIPHRNHQNQLIGIKYRHLHPQAPNKYTSLAGSRFSLYGIQSLKDATGEAVILTEGEFDRQAIYQHTSRYPILGFSGMSSFKESWLKLLEPFKKIYIAFDNQEAADEVAQQLADKLKAYRCYRVRLPDQIKDVNDLVKQAGTRAVEVWNQLLTEAKCMGTPLTKDLGEYTDETVAYYTNSEGLTLSTGYPALDAAMGGYAPGRAYLVKGATKIGKTTFFLDHLVNIARPKGDGLPGTKVLIGSFEMKQSEMNLKIISKVLGRDVEQSPKLSPTQLRTALDYVESWGTIAYIDRHSHVRLSDLYDAVKLRYAEGYRVLLIDHVQFLMNLGSDKEGAVFSQTVRVSKYVKKLTNDFPELVVIAITELNNAGDVMGGTTLKYDLDCVLNYTGNSLVCEEHRLGGGRYKHRSVQIRWNPTTYTYTVI